MKPTSLLIAVVFGVGMLSCQMTINSESHTAGAESAQSDALTTGLTGRVMLAAPCPGPAREDQPCPDQPFSAAFNVLDANNDVVARFQSNADGRFQVLLQPGRYTVVPDTNVLVFNAPAQRQPVTVQTRRMTEVTLRFDSGMR